MIRCRLCDTIHPTRTTAEIHWYDEHNDPSEYLEEL